MTPSYGGGIVNIVSFPIFEAYLECVTKCWLRSRAEPSAGNVYAEWARAQNEAYRQDGLNKLLATFAEGDFAMRPLISKNSKNATWRIAIDVPLRTNDLESRLHAVERVASNQFTPYRFEFANKLTKQHKLLVAFDTLLLSEAVRHPVTLAKIMHGDDHATLKVRTAGLAGEVRKRIMGSPPSSARRACNLGSANTAFTALLSFSMMSGGVSFGAMFAPS
jgi:hypothetical protein